MDEVKKLVTDIRNKNLAPEDQIEYNKCLMYSGVVGVIAGIIALLVYKQVLVHKGSSDLMTENFYSL